MGRPKEHDTETREALRAAAERLFDAGGRDAVSVRALADEVGTTTRAVYSLFGSLDGLLVDALGARAYELLIEALAAHPETDDPVADLVDMAPSVFRHFVVEHPALYRFTFQRVVAGFRPGAEFLEARAAALAALTAKLQRLVDAGVLRKDRDAGQAVIEFQALCEGLANFEIRGATAPMMPSGHEDARWRAAFTTLLRGMTTAAPRRGKR